MNLPWTIRGLGEYAFAVSLVLLVNLQGDTYLLVYYNGLYVVDLGYNSFITN